MDKSHGKSPPRKTRGRVLLSTAYPRATPVRSSTRLPFRRLIGNRGGREVRLFPGDPLFSLSRPPPRPPHVLPSPKARSQGCPKTRRCPRTRASAAPAELLCL